MRNVAHACVCKNISLLCKTGDDHRWLHMITDVLYMVKYKVSSLAVIVDLFYCIYIYIKKKRMVCELHFCSVAAILS